MRQLCLSEKRCISNLMHQEWGVRLQSEPAVISEYLWDPFKTSNRPNFNFDFSLEFDEDFTMRPDRAATMSSVLPNTLGAEVYLFVETATFTPLHFELLSGAAFSIKYYLPFIDRLETAVKDAALSDALTSKCHSIGMTSTQEFIQQVSVKRSAFARVLVIGSDICFFYFPNDEKPILRGTRLSIAKADDREIDCYCEGEKVICFDGWIRTVVNRSDRILVATAE